jgi:Na+-translocating ferredoxin:NAD+ oxidoreductase RnfD subunit
VYISGISVGILVKSPELWPFVMCGLISIASKYVLRVGGRHIWNPSNFGITVLLFLAGDHVASLSVQSGNEVWPVILIWILGSLILYRLGLLHIPLVFLAVFIPLAFVRSAVTGNPWQAELAPATWPMFQLYIIFMITDPKTITRTRPRQCLVAALIAVMETVLRLGLRDIYSLYHALFIVGPSANLIEIWWTARRKAAPAAAV